MVPIAASTPRAAACMTAVGGDVTGLPDTALSRWVDVEHPPTSTAASATAAPRFRQVMATAWQTAQTSGSEAAEIIWRSIKLALTQRTIGSVSGPQASTTSKVDAVLVGTGIMSATLSALLRRLEPSWSITVVERLDGAAAESSDPWNNAGTGHAGLCELFYTPQLPDGSIDIGKAVRVNEEFQVTRQFWAYAAENGMVSDVRGFLNPVPHVSFVQGAERVDYLRRRRQALAGNPLFARTEWIEDADEFARRLPYMAAKRDLSGSSAPIALTWAADGTDVDFGALSRQLIGYGVRNGTDCVVRPRGPQFVASARRQLGGGGAQSSHRRKPHAGRQIRLRRRGRASAAVAAEVRHQGSQGLWRLPDRRTIPAQRQSRDHRAHTGPRSTACRHRARPG